MTDDRRPPLYAVPDPIDTEGEELEQLERSADPRPVRPPSQAAPSVPSAGIAGLGRLDATAVATHALAFAAAAAGGALVGWLAAGDGRGAAIGAGVNVAIFGLSEAVFNPAGLEPASRGGYGALGLAAAVSTGYLVWTRS